MGRTKDQDIIWDAAESWLHELQEYIVPGVLTKEERKSYRKQADKLKNAMAREYERLRRKAIRDEVRANEKRIRLHNEQVRKRLDLDREDPDPYSAVPDNL